MGIVAPGTLSNQPAKGVAFSRHPIAHAPSDGLDFLRVCLPNGDNRGEICRRTMESHYARLMLFEIGLGGLPRIGRDRWEME